MMQVVPGFVVLVGCTFSSRQRETTKDVSIGSEKPL
jgi:hypothetical protein